MQIIPLTKDKIYTIDITSIGSNGEGVGKYEGFTVFIPGALAGEIIRAKIETLKKNYAIGKIVEFIKTSEKRKEPPCKIYELCGGCQLQHAEYDEQLKIKRQIVIDAIERIAKFKNITVYPVIPSPDSLYYRNKMQFPLGIDNNNTLVLGCYMMGTHKVVNATHCHIQHELNNVIANSVRKAAQELEIPVYNEKTRQGILRHVIGRVGTHSGEVMIVIVTATEKLPKKDEFVKMLRDSIPQVVSIMQNINSKPTNVILGHHTIKLWGKDTINERLGKLTFKVSANSFFQVNTKQAEQLYRQALKYCQLTGKETVIDAYCGTGTITLFLAQQAKKVCGIEVVEAAIKDARENSRINRIDNVEFYVGDVTKVMPQLYKQGIKPDVVLVDPPRAGCSKEVLETFVKMMPKRIVYVSCNPASLARDIAILAELGYIAREIQPFDMFPQTAHVECVALIERK